MLKEYGLLGLIGSVVAVLFCVALVAVVGFCFVELVSLGVGGVVLVLVLALGGICFWK